MPKSKDPVRFTLRVTDSGFIDVLKTPNGPGERSTAYELDPISMHPRASLRTLNGKKTIMVKSRGAPIRYVITIETDKGGKEQYFPRGITFSNVGPRPGVKTPDKIADERVFPFYQLHFWKNSRTLTIPDAFTDIGKNDRFKFSVIIQRVSDGAIGIIDPPIEHDNSR